MSRIYLDHNATTPLEEAVLEAMLPYLREHFGNPSSIHRFGQDTRRAMDRARQQVAGLINADPAEIVFTGSGTEADNLALRGPFERTAARPTHVVTTAVEHPAVLNPCTLLEQRGVRVTRVAVDETGRVDPAAVAGAVVPETALVSVMLANNDVGTIQPVPEIAALLGEARERGLLLHSDAVQAAGKLPIDVEKLGVDLLSLSAHKIGGPKGCGALYLRRSAGRIDPLILGGAQEHGHRAGTENVAAIVGFGRACELAEKRLQENAGQIAALRDRLQRGILTRVPGARVNGHPTQRLPNTINVTFPGLGLDGEALLMNLDLLGIAVSTGSACSSGSLEPSHVLLAMGLSTDEARSAIRFSLGAGNTAEQIDAAVEAIARVVGQLLGTATHG